MNLNKFFWLWLLSNAEVTFWPQPQLYLWLINFHLGGHNFYL